MECNFKDKRALLFVLKDMTYSIKHENVLKEVKMQEMVVATLNHELRNPLNVLILMLMELLELVKENLLAIEIIKACQTSTSFLLNLIE